jgi:hypothetical protein
MATPTTDAGGIRQTIRALVADGWRLDRVEFGDEPEPVRNETEAMAIITNLDDAFLVVTRGEESGWVRFVMGNDPEEVVCDYTINLECVQRLTSGWD